MYYVQEQLCMYYFVLCVFSTLFAWKDLERKNKVLENDLLCATLESSKFKLSLEQEKEKQKNTLEASDAKYNLLMETVVEKDRQINNLHEELSVCGNVTVNHVCLIHWLSTHVLWPL